MPHVSLVRTDRPALLDSTDNPEAAIRQAIDLARELAPISRHIATSLSLLATELERTLIALRVQKLGGVA